MKVIMHTGGIAATNCYLLADEDAKQAVLFDAPDHSAQTLLDKVRENNWDLVGLWLTHGHFDHIADHKTVTDAFPSARVLIHPLDEPKLRNPGLQSRLFELPFTIPPGAPHQLIHDNDALRLGAFAFTVIHTPGHSPGHVMFHCPDAELLIGGDLIIMNAVGRTDLPDSNHNDLNASIRKVMKLPPSTQLLSGHGAPSTLEHELQTNEYVQEAMEQQT